RQRGLGAAADRVLDIDRDALAAAAAASLDSTDCDNHVARRIKHPPADGLLWQGRGGAVRSGDSLRCLLAADLVVVGIKDQITGSERGAGQARVYCQQIHDWVSLPVPVEDIIDIGEIRTIGLRHPNCGCGQHTSQHAPQDGSESYRHTYKNLSSSVYVVGSLPHGMDRHQSNRLRRYNYGI